MMVVEVLGIIFDKVDIFEIDMDVCIFNFGDYVSRGVFVEGGGVKKIVEKLKNFILEEVEKLFEILKEDLYLDNGCVISKFDENVKVLFFDVVVYS